MSKTLFPVINRKTPELFREQFPYTEVPRTLFDGTMVIPSHPPKEIWITDTTFRDGQQSRPPYTPDQIIRIFDLLHKLSGPNGIIRQSEFFLYSERDKKAVEGCLERGYRYPEITGWIRAHRDDLPLVREMGIRETGILVSASDYHIYLKQKMNREEAMESYLAMTKAALEMDIIPRCHFEDITRADIYGFCLPLAEQLMRIGEESGKQIKIRLCDTMGYGVPFPGAVLPRSVPRLAHAFINDLGYPAELLEWHGHNDFHMVLSNGVAAWLNGIPSMNTSLFGYGERTGNPPLEGAVMQFISLTGSNNGMDTRVITELAEYYTQSIHAPIPSNYPFVGSDFNTTRAGIHADGILKNQEIYNIFDTEKLLNRPLKTMITDKSGMAGIAQWLNENIPMVLSGEAEQVSKRQPGVRHIYTWVTEQYEQGRTTSISGEELITLAKRYIPSIFESDFGEARKRAVNIAKKLADRIGTALDVRSLSPELLEPYLADVIRKEKSIQLLAITNTEGKRISQVHTQRGEKRLFRNLLSKDFTEKEWFIHTLETGEIFLSDLFFSKYTGKLIITAALPIRDESGTIFAVMDIDFTFDELVKQISDLPEELMESL